MSNVQYEEYIQSPEWRERAEKIRAEYDNKCYICGSSNNLHIHHISYKRLGSEIDRDVVCLCRDCHMKVHEIKDAVRDIYGEGLYALDKWRDEMLLQHQEFLEFFHTTYTKMQNALKATATDSVPTIVDMYAESLGHKTIRGHLPKIGRVISETCGFEGVSLLVTKQLADKLKKR